MKRLLIILNSILMLTACNTQKNANIDGEWNIVTVEGKTISVDEDLTAPFLGFNSADKSIYGSTSCNNLTGFLNMNAEKQTIDFSNTGSTRMMCHDMETERMILEALAKIVTYEVEGETLKFQAEDGKTVMELQKK